MTPHENLDPLLIGGQAFASRLLLADEQVGERIYFRHVAGERRKRVVVEIAAELRNRAVALDLLVDEFVAAPAGARPPEEPQAVVGIPVAVHDPAIDEPDFAWKPGAGELLTVGAGEKRDERSP